MFAQVADKQGNITRVDRRFFIGDAPPGPEPVVCAPAPVTGCVDAAKSKLTMRGTGTRRLTWKWAAGPVVAASDLGDPVTGASAYRLCLYDGGGALLADLGVPAGRLCGNKPCWRRMGERFKFKDTSGRNRGVIHIGLKPGAVGKGRADVKAKGANLPLPALPIVAAAGTTVQLQRDDDPTRCWQAVFSASLKNTSALFSARLP